MRELVRKLSSNSFASESKEEIGNDLSQLYHIRASSGGTCIVCREWLVDRATGAFRFFDVTSGLQGDMGLTTEVFRVWIAQRVFLRQAMGVVLKRLVERRATDAWSSVILLQPTTKEAMGVVMKRLAERGATDACEETKRLPRPGERLK
ncbi:hypothetical protein GW17_00031267 [Ensete ventricosum]|nr:hypothetical protein GW17_00031267 [Ensete ventricosum]